MNAKQLATAILQYRNSSSLVIPGTMRADVGPEAMQDALDRRWVEPDHDSGYLKLSSQQSKIEEMRALAEGKCETCSCDPCKCCEKCCKHPCVCDKSESQDSRPFMTAHLARHQVEAFNAPAAYGSGQPQKPVGPVVQPAAQPASAGPNRSEDPMVGEDVVIADEGRSYSAKVSEKNPDGTFKLSFGPNRPARERTFRKEEIQRVKPGDVQLTK